MAIPFRIVWGNTSENPCGGGGKINVKKIHLGWAGVKFAVLA